MWLSMRFPDMLPDEPRVREASKLLDKMIQVILYSKFCFVVFGFQEGVESFMSLISVAQSESKEPRASNSQSEKVSKSSEKTKKASRLEALLKRADISEEDLEQLRDELNKKKT